MLFVSGQVRSTSGELVARAELDIWMTNSAGDYSGLTPEMLGPILLDLDESIPPYNLRGKILTDDTGYFEYRTVMPGIETIGVRKGARWQGFSTSCTGSTSARCTSTPSSARPASTR